MKGFQVAPGKSQCNFPVPLQCLMHCTAELEGHLLSHPAVLDTCVVGIPDEYRGEVPLAYVALEPDYAARVKKDRKEGERIMADIIKVRVSPSFDCLQLRDGLRSMLQITRLVISVLKAVLSSWMLFPRIHRASSYGVY